MELLAMKLTYEYHKLYHSRESEWISYLELLLMTI